MAQHDQLNGAEILLKALVDQGVEVIFGYPGGAVLPIYDELFKQNRLRHVLVRHEQAAVHAAEGYARSTGRVGCVLVTSGPGATNTVTGLADALCDSVPLVCFTGQVPTHLIGNDAFQEADITGITRPCTKHNYLVKDVNKLARTVHEAFQVARAGRPGPVLVDLPKDVVQAHGLYEGPSKGRSKYQPQVKGDIKAIERAVELIAGAKRPVFYVGGGVINSGTAACQLLTQLVRMTGYPCTQTLMGLGAYPASDALSLGMLGMHGTYEANLAMHGCDVMINIGARFDDRVTGRLNAFAPTAKKIHIDIDPSSINKNVAVDVAVVGDCAHVLEDLMKVWKAKQCRPDDKALRAWWAQIDKWRSVNCLHYEKSSKIIKPQYAIQRLYELTKNRNPYICTEVGQHQMWAAQHFRFELPNHWMTSGGLGTMGYGLPSAMGVQVAHPDALVVDIAGESSIQMNIQELATLCQHRLPVKVFILNNQYMGMVRQWQELIHGGRYSQSHMDAHPDFVKLADAYGAVGLKVEKPGDLDDAIKEMISVERTVIMDVRTDASENCFPMIMPGMAHNEMVLGPEDKAMERPGSEEDGMVLV
ncbi:MAG: acetolactate synthase 3 large subunit [Magnetospirillum sp.]|nr:acetolactate synthase 3 large subunit [Magnetospirillum sp.]